MFKDGLGWIIVLLIMAAAAGGAFFLVSGGPDTSEQSREKLATQWSTDMGFKPDKVSCIRYGGGHGECTVRSGDKLFTIDCYTNINQCTLKASIK